MGRGDVGIVGFGGYIPRLRLERQAIAEAHSWFNPGLKASAKGTRAMSSWDEDSVTMAVEAARECLREPFAGRDPIHSLSLASLTLPFADRQNACIVKEALDLPDGIETCDFAGGRRAGTSALLTALHTASARDGNSLCLAAEKAHSLPASEFEMESGDGAAACLVGRRNMLARFLGSYSVSVDFVDRFRASGREFDYGWEGRWVREEGHGKIVVDVVREALEVSGIHAAEVAHLASASTAPGSVSRLARALALPRPPFGDDLHSQIGFAGAAQPLLLLGVCLERARPGDKIVIVSFGQGCDVLVFEATAAINGFSGRAGIRALLALGKPTRNYLRYLVFNGLLKIDRGMRAEMDQKTALTALYRDRRTVLGLVGSRDPATGKVQYPRTSISVHAAVARDAVQEDYRLADRPARIVTFTADRLAFSLDPPSYYGMVEFEGGGRMVADFADMDPEDAVVGREMKMVFRIKALDEGRGFVRYFWKAVPRRSVSLSQTND